MIHDAAVTAAAEALAGCPFVKADDALAEVAVAAARPIIEAETVERVLALIDAEAAILDAITITHQERAAQVVAQVKREGVLAARAAVTKWLPERAS